MDKRHFQSMNYQTDGVSDYHHYIKNFVDRLNPTLDGIIAMSGT